MFVRRSKQKIVKYTNRSAVSPEERVVIKFTRKQGHFLRSLDSLLDNVHTVQSYSPEARTFRASRTIDQEPLNTVLYYLYFNVVWSRDNVSIPGVPYTNAEWELNLLNDIQR